MYMFVRACVCVCVCVYELRFEIDIIVLKSVSKPHDFGGKLAENGY